MGQDPTPELLAHQNAEELAAEQQLKLAALIAAGLAILALAAFGYAWKLRRRPAPQR